MVDAHTGATLDLPLMPPPIKEAFRACQRLTRTHYENFSVLSVFVPRALRGPLAALYAYCRIVDDFGDERLPPGGVAARARAPRRDTLHEDRLAALDRCESELDAAFRGRARHPVFVALQETIARFNLPRQPLARLIEANRMDQRSARYATFDDVLHYCAHSANPVGRLVLALHGHHDKNRCALSDATCTALQLTNFWQDLKRDVAIDRIYLPQDEMAAYDVAEEELAADVASEPLRALIAFQVARTRTFFAQGLPLIDRVPGRLRGSLALFSRGGLAILAKIEEQGFDTLSRRPTLSKRDKAGLAISTLASRRWRQRM
jgi:squalene synthase HpnC